MEGGAKDDLKHSTSFSNILTGVKNSAPSAGGEKINLFGGSSQANTGQQPGGSLFGQPAQKQGHTTQSFPRSGGLFGGGQQNQSPNGLALAKKESVTAPPANSNLLQTPVKPSNPNQGEGQTNPFGFGDNTNLSPNQNTGGGGGLFGAKPAATTTTGGGLFGSNSKPANSGGLFGGSNTTTTPTSGGLFGGGGSTQTPSISVGPLGGSTAGTTSGGLFGGQASKPNSGGTGLFGSATPSTSGGLFGSSTPGQTGFQGQGQGQQQNQPQQQVNQMTVAQYMKQAVGNDDFEAAAKLQAFEALLTKGSGSNIHQGVFFERYQKTDRQNVIQLLKQKVPVSQPDYEDANIPIKVNAQKYAAAQKINPNKAKYFPMQVNSTQAIETRAGYSEEAVQKLQQKMKEMEEWERGKKNEYEAQIREQLQICHQLNVGIKKKIFRLYVKLSEFIVHTNHDQSNHLQHEKLNTEIDQEIQENNQAAQVILQTKQALHSVLPSQPVTQEQEPESVKAFDHALAQDETINMLLDVLGEEKMKLERDCHRAQNLVKLVTCLERESYIVKAENVERTRLY